jgi:hypothetical protein
VGRRGPRVNTVDLGIVWNGFAASVEGVAQAGDPLIEGVQLEAMALGIVRAFEAALVPGSHMVAPGRLLAGRHRRRG